MSFHFQAKFSVCLTLDVDVNLTSGFDVNPTDLTTFKDLE